MRFDITLRHPFGVLPGGVRVQSDARLLALTEGLTADDLVLCLISGGGSALLTLPAEGLTLAEIGQVLGVTESRICQMHTKAVLQLRGKLADQDD